MAEIRPSLQWAIPQSIPLMSAAVPDAHPAGQGVADTAAWLADSDHCLSRLREAGKSAIAEMERAESWSQVTELLQIQSRLFERYVRLQRA